MHPWNLAAKLGEALRILEEFDDFLELFARFVDAGDVFKGNFALTFGQQLGLGFAKTHRAACTAALLHLPQCKECDAEDQQEGKRLDQDHQQRVHPLDRRARIADIVLFEQFDQLGVAADGNGGEGFLVLECAGNLVGCQRNFLNRAFDDLIAEARIIDLRRGGCPALPNIVTTRISAMKMPPHTSRLFTHGLAGCGSFSSFINRGSLSPTQCRDAQVNGKITRRCEFRRQPSAEVEGLD